jgi:DNA-binding phage protein
LTESTHTHATVHVADAGLQRRLRAMIDRRGLAAVARDTGIARESLARYLANIHVQTGTFQLIETTLAGIPAPPGVR